MRLKTLTGARLLPLLGLLALLGLASPARAQVTLQSLLAGGTLTVGPLTFANFRDFQATASGGATAVNPNLVFVTTIADGVNFGLRFNSATQFLTGTGQTQDTLFTYDVFATAGGNAIFDNTLSIGGFGTIGTGLILVGESRSDENGNPVPDISTPPRTSKFVTSNPALGGINDNAIFATPQNFLTIQKDIGLAGGTNGTAFLSDFEQTFSIPEPGTLALVGLSVFGLGGYAWRRRKPAAV